MVTYPVILIKTLKSFFDGKAVYIAQTNNLAHNIHTEMVEYNTPQKKKMNTTLKYITIRSI